METLGILAYVREKQTSILYPKERCLGFFYYQTPLFWGYTRSENGFFDPNHFPTGISSKTIIQKEKKSLLGAVVFGSDQGLVGQFNDTLARFWGGQAN